MFAAKPVVWKGRSDLPQVSWAPSLKGTWLVVDMWAGASGLCMMLLQLGAHFYAASAEPDSDAVAVTQSNMPNIVHVARVEDLSAGMFRSFLQRRSCRGIILGGGSPCQGNSSLNAGRQGLDDPRSLQAFHVARLKQEFKEMPESSNLQIVTLLENVASMPDAVQSQYNDWLEASPVEADSATCGWVHRRRFYWLVGPKGPVHAGCRPPSDWAWQAGKDGKPPKLIYVGKTPLPPRLSLSQGFQPLLDPTQVLKAGGQGAMYPFTREFFHPTDRCSQATPQAVSRFMEDARRFPPSAYEEHCLLWKQETWRQPEPHERCQLMGWPAEAVSSIRGSGTRRRQVQNSIIGNGFHLYTLLALFCMLPQVLSTKLTLELPCMEELALKERITGTVWEPGRLTHFPGLLTGPELVQSTKLCFPDCPIPAQAWTECGNKLKSCDLTVLQTFTAWCRIKGLPWEVLGPTLVHKRDRTALYAGLTGQRYAAQSSRGLDFLLPPGLGKEEHCKRSLLLPTPFAPRDWPELDVAFVLDGIRVWRGALPRWTQRLRNALRMLASALEPVEAALTRWRVPNSLRVAL